MGGHLLFFCFETSRANHGQRTLINNTLTPPKHYLLWQASFVSVDPKSKKKKRKEKDTYSIFDCHRPCSLCYFYPGYELHNGAQVASENPTVVRYLHTR